MHVGLHKTGTTAFQEALDLAEGELRERGVLVMQNLSPFIRDSPASQAFDLANAVVRSEADAYFRLLAPDLCSASSVRASERRVRACAAANSQHLVASMECLSLIDSETEVERLVDLLAPRRVTVVLVLRERLAFLESLRAQVARMGLPTSSTLRDSCLHLADDTWLVDYERKVATFTQVLGEDRVVVLDYDESVARDGSVVPSLWRAVALPEIPSQAALFGRGWVNRTPIDRAPMPR